MDSVMLFRVFQFIIVFGMSYLRCTVHDVANGLKITSSLLDIEKIPFPAAFTDNNRVCGVILAFNFNRIDPILIILSEYKSMCEAGWDPTVAFLTTVEVSDVYLRFLQQKTFCYRTQKPITIEMVVTDTKAQHNVLSGVLIAEYSRTYIAKRLNDFDVFIYHEEDVMVQYTLMMAYLAETKQFMNLMSDSTEYKYNGLYNFSMGFQRYQHYFRSPETRNTFLSDDEFSKMDALDAIPLFKPICLRDRPYLKIVGYPAPLMTPHQGMFMLTRQQIEILNEKCGFLQQSLSTRNKDIQSYTREYMSSLSIFDNHIIPENCGLIKLLPAEHFASMTVNHYYGISDNPFVGRTHPVFTTMEHITAGMIQSEVPLSYASYFDNITCWQPIIAKHRLAQNITNTVRDKITLYKTSTKAKQIYALDNGIIRAVSGEVFERREFKFEDVILFTHPAMLKELTVGSDLD